ncbi:helix-turn-helix domain-containing protein [Neoaquamicrobium sediminum]|uniref:Helix-turn-helix domain-containing protein n=1 Tax=Neoaquamicrobium sediminum TaxID=1849104 RepID=A0ABV3WY14_9HYPH
MGPDADLAAIAMRPGATVLSTPEFTLVKVPPVEELRGLVVEIGLYRELSGAPMPQLETASLVVPLLIGFAEPFEIALGRRPGIDDGYQSFTSGLCLQPVNIMSAGRCSCVQISFTPLGARRFFGLPMHELTSRMVTLGELGDRSVDRLRQQLGEEASWDRRLVIAERFAIDRLRNGQELSRGTAWAYDRILATNGRAKVARLAAELDWSRKHLAARFHDEVGLPPKAVARVARFMRAQSLARARTEGGWADIAAGCGYADQAHLARDFREFAGTTPSAWLAGT